MIKAIIDAIPIVPPEIGNKIYAYSIMNIFETIMDTEETLSKDIDLKKLIE